MFWGYVFLCFQDLRLKVFLCILDLGFIGFQILQFRDQVLIGVLNGFQGLQDLGFLKVLGFRFSIQGFILGFRFQGLRFFYGLGFYVKGFIQVFRVQGFGFFKFRILRVSGLRFFVFLGFNIYNLGLNRVLSLEFVQLKGFLSFLGFLRVKCCLGYFVFVSLGFTYIQDSGFRSQVFQGFYRVSMIQGFLRFRLQCFLGV